MKHFHQLTHDELVEALIPYLKAHDIKIGNPEEMIVSSLCIECNEVCTVENLTVEVSDQPRGILSVEQIQEDDMYEQSDKTE